MDKPPNMPRATPNLSARITQLTTPEYAAFQLRATWAKSGQEAAVNLSNSFVEEV